MAPRNSNNSMPAPPRPSVALQARPEPKSDAWQLDRGDLACTVVLLLLLLLCWVGGKIVPPVVDNCVAAAVNGCVWRELGNSSWKIENRAV